MWLFTKDGFFSVVQDRYCKPGQVTVRARVKEDLERMLKAGNITASILEIPYADYLYRAIITRKQWAMYCQREADRVNYPNVKQALCDDNVRQNAYLTCWHALYKMQADYKLM